MSKFLCPLRMRILLIFVRNTIVSFYRSASTMKSHSLIISNNGSPSFDNSPKNRRHPRQRVRMSRCGKCIGCNSKNCGKCYKCLDMVKYGGPGTLKQACEKRQCIDPQMPDSSPSKSIKTSSKGIQ